MTRANRTDQVAGIWLAIGSLLIIATLILHGPIAPDLGDQMKRVAEGPVRWAVAHWIAAAGFSLFAMTGLVVLGSRSRLTASSPTLTAWAVVSVGALWTITTAVAEATVVAAAAASGNMGTFEAWWAFAEGKATGFAFVALAVAVIARNEAQSSERAAPAWSAWIAMVAGVVSFAGWALGMWFDIGFGSHLWVASSILMSVWTLWFGVALMRSQADGV